MPYFPKTKILYIHIPKCYGTSVEAVLQKDSDMTLYVSDYPPLKPNKQKPISTNNTYPQHYTFKEIENYNIDVTYSFATVRNPYLRAISQWKYQVQYKHAFPEKKVHVNFNMWVRDLYKNFLNKTLKNTRHDWLQTYYIFDDNDVLLIDKLMPCERLTNINGVRISHLNKSKLSKSPEITNEIATILFKIYERDFRLLRYSPDIKKMYNPSI
jgi:hypothetical protein